MSKGRKAYFAANLISQASALVRYVVLARLLGEHELGLAAMLLLTSQFFESVSDTGSDRFIVQDGEGDTTTMQGVVQAVLAARGVLIALGLLATSGILATLYHQPQLQMPLVLIGLSPLIGGFVHLDMRRAQRTQDYRPESLALVVSEIVSLTATSIAAYATRDHSAVIVGLVLRALSLVAISHLTAKRRYGWAWGRVEASRFSLFAMPLFLNGLLLFLGGQGDRLVVASNLGAAALGQYSSVLLLAYYPTTMAARFLTGIHLPQVSASRYEGAELEAARWRLASQTALLSAGIVVGFAIAAPIFVPLLYGENFSQPLQVIALMGLLQALRFIRFWPTTIAIGAGRSMIVMLNNVARMVGLPIAILAHLQWGRLEAVVGGFIVGEFVALVAALALLARENAVQATVEGRRVATFLVIGLATVAAAWLFQAGHSLEGGACVAVGLTALAAAFMTERATLDTLRLLLRRRLKPGA